MKTSARNELHGKVVALKSGGVMSEVVVKVSEDIAISANITNDSLESLGLEMGSEVMLLIKSSFVILSKEQLKSSARNNIKSVVSEVIKGGVNSEVKLSLEHQTLCAVITNDAAEDLGLQKGDVVYAMFKASSVILIAK